MDNEIKMLKDYVKRDKNMVGPAKIKRFY